MRTVLIGGEAIEINGKPVGPSAVAGKWRAAIAPAIASLFLWSAIAAAAESTLAGRVLDALGGAERLRAAGAIETTSEGTAFTDKYNYAPGGPPIYLSHDKIVTLWQPATGRFRVHARLDSFFPYGVVEKWDYQEAFDGTNATRSGPRDYRRGTDGPLPAAYLGAGLKRLWLFHPQWLFAHATRITPAGERSATGDNVPDLLLEVQNSQWLATIDPKTFLPRAVTIHEPEGIRSEISIRVEFDDWRRVDGIMMPFRLTQYVDGVLNRRELRTGIHTQVDVTEDDFRVSDIPSPQQPDMAQRQWGWDMSHWFLNRTAMGRPTDTRRLAPLVFEKIGDGLFMVIGSSHHNLVIVGPQGLAIIEAPFYPERSQAVLAALKDRWPDKPLRYLILTHHHLDHSGGFRSYIAAGAQLVVSAPATPFFSAAIKRGTDMPPHILSVTERISLPDFGRVVEVMSVPNSHALGMLIAYVPDEKLLFVTDLFSPGRPKTATRSAVSAKQLLSAVRFYNLDIDRIAGGHGRGIATIPDLEKGAAR